MDEFIVLVGIVVDVIDIDGREMADDVAGDFAERIDAVLAGSQDQAGKLLDSFFELVVNFGADVGDDDVSFGLLGDGDVEFL